jgi:hypothetical protein
VALSGRVTGRGFVLAELLVALVIAAVIGVAITQLVVSQSRFVALQGGVMQARGGARAALNVLTADLRMVTDSGLVQASPESVTVRVPYAYGVACAQQSGKTIVSLLPADSAVYASASVSGYAWRDSTGKYTFVQPATTAPAASWICSGASPPIALLGAPGWPGQAAALTPNDVRTPQGAIVFLYQLVQYAFAPSTQLPGKIALWRSVVSAGTRAELVAPFDSISGFQFLVGSALTPQASPPADLRTVRGLRLVLAAASELPPEGRSLPVQFRVTTDVVFRNVL